MARNDTAVRTLEELPREISLLAGELDTPAMVRMNGFQMEADLLRGQKTGIFLDQRENYLAAARYATGKALDCFTSTGGFALHLARTCERVEAIDSSAPALAAARRNAERNDILNATFPRSRCVRLAFPSYSSARDTFDPIVLDPPAFAKSRKQVEGAMRGYKDINLRALRLLGPGGVLVTCSCSHHVSEAMLLEVVAEASLDAGRTLRVLDRRTQAQDHPILSHSTGNDVPEVLSSCRWLAERRGSWDKISFHAMQIQNGTKSDKEIEMPKSTTGEGGRNTGGRRGFLKGAAAGAAALVAKPGRVKAQEVAQTKAAGTSLPSARLAAAETAPPRRRADVYSTDRPGADFMLEVIKTLGFPSTFAPIPDLAFAVCTRCDPEPRRQTKTLNCLTCCHEESSVAMAHGYAKIEGKPLMVMAHGTVGLQHASDGDLQAAFADSRARIHPSRQYCGRDVETRRRGNGRTACRMRPPWSAITRSTTISRIALTQFAGSRLCARTRPP